MSLSPQKTKEFRAKLASLPREELKRLIAIQDPDLAMEVDRIEWVFKNKMSHLKWKDGSTITERDLTNEELALLIDEPFEVLPELLELGISAEQQKELHYTSDVVLWSKHFLKNRNPRAYQTLVLRDSGTRKVLRWGRRCLAKGTMVMTTEGPKPIQLIKAGEYVYDEHGRPIKVLKNHDQGVQEVIEIKHNGKVIAASTVDHRWLFTHKQKNGSFAKPYVSTVAEMDMANAYIETRIPDLILNDAYESRIKVELGEIYKAPTYDLTVNSQTELYLLHGHGLVTHNTGKSTLMAILMLHRCITRANYKVIVVAPMIKHVKVLYEDIASIIEDNDYVDNAVKRHVASPSPEINFTTGSTIKFFTSGMKSGGKADATRGQEADLIILDELDYMHPDDLIAILAMLQQTRKDQEEKELIGASTPTGAHSIFYEWCNDKDLFKEYYFPSYVNPNWTKQVEAEMRQLYQSENAYKHEIEADWGENAEGVYPRSYLDSAFLKNDWPYVIKDVSKTSDFFFGVDWDKYGAGTNIVVLEKISETFINNELAGKVRVVYREETPREQFTYVNAVNRIIELDSVFRPKYIYVDRGSGEAQVEMLHRHGVENPFSGFGKKVKGIAFKQVIQLFDPFTKMPVRKEAKPFMVDNLYQFLENGLIKFPAHDEELYEQLLSYIIVRMSQNDVPVFDTVNGGPDHAHDALLLAALAITENYGEFFKVDLATQARGFSNEFFIPIFHDNGTKQKVGEKSTNITSSRFEPQDYKEEEKASSITRSMPYNIRSGKSKRIHRKSF